MLIGAHVPGADPLGAAAQRRADCVQLFLSNPQSWRKPASRDDADALRAAALPLYVHAPYLVNVASPNSRVRIPSRRILQETCDAAAEIGAAAVVVHGGHVGPEADVDEGCANWRKALERLQTDVPVRIENTAGGEHALARRLDVLGRLWDRLEGLAVGFCLDTCHLHAAGEPLEGVVDRVKGLVGRIDLVHANDSRDDPGSGRDRHANLGRGRMHASQIAAVAAAAGAPVICETPGGPEDQAADIAWLRGQLS